MDPLLPSAPIDAWYTARDTAVWGFHGIASLRSTTWLTESPVEVPSIAGQWRRHHNTIVGHGACSLDVREQADGDYADPIHLEPGEKLIAGPCILVAFSRDQELALRVFESDTKAATEPGRIERFDYAASWVVQGHFTPFTAAVTLPSVAVDGHQSTANFDGEITFTAPDGGVFTLMVRIDGGIYFAPFADATVADAHYRFRMIRIVPDSGGDPMTAAPVTVDFNRAYLPPSAFSRGYVCVTPPPANVISVRIDAGERRVSGLAR